MWPRGTWGTQRRHRREQAMGALDGRVAIVTGGSGAVGSAISLALAAEGSRIVVHYGTHRDAAEAVVGAISVRGGVAKSIQADLAVPSGGPRGVAGALEVFGRIDILVNNAGMIRDTLILRMKDEDWQAVLDTNLSSAFYCTRAILREFVRQHGGRIINSASIVAEIGNHGQPNYVPATEGMIGLTKAVAPHGGSGGITVDAGGTG